MTPPLDVSTPFIMPGVGGVSKDLVKTILKELITEEPGLFEGLIKDILKDEGIIGQLDNGEAIQSNETLTELLEETREGQATIKRNVRRVGLLIGTVEALDEDDKEILDELKENSTFVQDLKQAGLKRDYEKELYAELKTRMSMKNREILDFFGIDRKNSMKATRLMKTLPTKYQDVIYERIPNKNRGFRIRLNR